MTHPEGPSGRAGSKLPLALASLPAILLAGGFIAALWLSPGVRRELRVVWDLLLGGDPEPLRLWLLQFGILAPVISGLLQVATSLIPILPSFLVAIANAMLYGALLGGVLTFATALIAAAACFGLARVIGRPGVERIVARRTLARVDGFMARRGILAVFLARLIPFINPDVVSYAAGVTGIRWPAFLAAIAAGSAPATVFYSIVGAAALDSTPWVAAAVTISTIVPLLLLWIFRDRILRATRDSNP